jgi:hypothetical protein
MRFWTWLLARLIAVAVILALALWYRMPEREFRRSIEAVKKVNSLHYAMVADVPMEHTEQEGDLSCPDDAFQEAMHIVSHQPDRDVSIDNRRYTRGRSAVRPSAQRALETRLPEWTLGASNVQGPYCGRRYLDAAGV